MLAQQENSSLKVPNVADDPVEELTGRPVAREQVGFVDDEELRARSVLEAPVGPVEHVGEMEREMVLRNASKVDHDGARRLRHRGHTVQRPERAGAKNLEEGREPAAIRASPNDLRR